MPKVTSGMLKAMMPDHENAKYRCSQCSLLIPVYPGRYPAQCPSCGGLFEEPNKPDLEASLEETVNKAVNAIKNGQSVEQAIEDIVQEFTVLGPEKSDILMPPSMKNEIKNRIKKKGNMNGFVEPVHMSGKCGPPTIGEMTTSASIASIETPFPVCSKKCKCDDCKKKKVLEGYTGFLDPDEGIPKGRLKYKNDPAVAKVLLQAFANPDRKITKVMGHYATTKIPPIDLTKPMKAERVGAFLRDRDATLTQAMSKLLYNRKDTIG